MWLHRAAAGTAGAVLLLIVVGAGVTSQDAGMAYPDWPTSAGHLINPPGWWQAGDTRWEHGHRLIGWIVGLLATGVAVLSWPRGGAIRAVGLTTFLAISVQGVLGGLRVTEVSTELAMMHGIWGQLCFCLATVSALLTSPAWTSLSCGVDTPGSTFLKNLCIVGLACVFVQLVLGATLRHFGGNHALAAHLIWAMVLTVPVFWIADRVAGNFSHFPLLVRLARSMTVLIIGQWVLGGMTFLVTMTGVTGIPLLRWVIPTAHVGAGSLLLACSLALMLSTHRLMRSGRLEPSLALHRAPAASAQMESS